MIIRLLLANTTKKYSNLKKGIGFKHSSTKKTISKASPLVAKTNNGDSSGKNAINGTV